MTSNSQRWTRILLILAVILAANVLLNRLFFRIDFTGDKRYTLSTPTKNILKDLEDPVTVTAYFSDDVPAQIAQTKADFKDLLEESERAAQQEGMQPVQVNMRERDQMKQQRVYLGAVIKHQSQKEVIPFMQPGAAMEYALSSSIKKISVVDKPKLGLIQGHGEPPINELQQVSGALSVLFDMHLICWMSF